MNAAVIVETRPEINLKQVCERHIKYLPGWELVIFCGLGNERQALELDATVHKLRVSNLDGSGYNKLLTSVRFWQLLEFERVLIFQHDSALLRKGIEEFLKYTYVGAPWKFQEHGGNGGLSLRNPYIMASICDRGGYDENIHGNEDVFFCNRVKELGLKLAPREVCSKFSTETIYKLGTLGFHSIQSYLSKEEINNILNFNKKNDVQI